ERGDGMSDQEFPLRLASPAELREMVQTLTRERDEARDELDGIAEVLDEAGVPQGADGPDGRRWTLSLGARVEYVIAERDEARAEVEMLRAVLAGEGDDKHERVEE